MAPWDERVIEFASRRFALLAEPTRLRILQLLERGEKSVGEIALTLNSTQPNASRHLQALYREEIVARRREGTSIFYSIADPVVQEICALMCGRLGPKVTETARARKAVPSKGVAKTQKGRPARKSTSRS
jgi:ArsR family transcriptional regulator